MNIKKWIVSALACFFSLPIMAQLGEERSNLAVGVNLGMNMTKVEFSPRIKQKSHNGMAFGVTARYMCEKYFNMMCAIIPNAVGMRILMTEQKILIAVP